MEGITNKGVQQIAETLSDVLKLDVTVVDSNLVRIAGTNSYKDRIGETLPSGSGYEYAINNKSDTIISTPGDDPVCQQCNYKYNCSEKAHMLSPIKLNGEVIAIIGITAFTENQKFQLMHAEEKYLSFISKMSELLADRFSHEQIIREKSDAYAQISAIVNSVYEGVLAVDGNENITACNDAVKELLGIEIGREKEPIGTKVSEIVPELPFSEVISSGQSKVGYEQYFTSTGVYCLVNIKPVKIASRVVGAVATFRDKREIQKLAFRVIGNTSGFSFDSIISNNDKIAELKEKARKISQTDSTVLIRGESGTGKELYARSIHSASPRWRAPFVPVHCGAIPESLLESELFGYEAGAFTGAKKSGKMGKFEYADQGTIFLDEIGDMPMHLQTKLLRVLQDGTFERVGGYKTVKANVRVLAATHRPLEEYIKENKFRRDLFYRLNVVPLYIPPLRKRREDIELLLNNFIEKYASKINTDKPVLSQELLDYLKNYSWPGNVRELENVAEYFLNVTDKKELDIDDLPHNMREVGDQYQEGKIDSDLLMPLTELEQKSFATAVNFYGTTEQGKQKIAEQLGVSRATVYRKLKKYNLL